MGQFKPTDEELIQIMQNRLRNMEQQKADIQIGIDLSERIYKDNPQADAATAQAKAQIADLDKGIAELEKMVEEKKEAIAPDVVTDIRKAAEAKKK
jgi:N-methylhydantoinase B/oxoprolinase/acetone carboxylase alpha subunit